MSIYLGAGSTVRQTSKLYVGVDGKARQVQKMYVGVDGKARLVYQSGTPIGSLAVGSTVKIKVNGTSTDFIIVQQGNPDTSVYDSSCGGTWLLMKDTYTSVSWDSSRARNNYKTSDVHSYLNGTFYNLIDADIRTVIKQVKIPYHSGDAYSDGRPAARTDDLSTKVFLLSGYEVGWTTSTNERFPKDGVKLTYFLDGSVADSNKKRVAYRDGSAKKWWLRSPRASDTSTSSVWCVLSDGSYDYDNCQNHNDIRPAFILPSATLVDENGSIMV